MQKIGFMLPDACPVKTFPSCTVLANPAVENLLMGQNVSETIAEDVAIDPKEAPPVDDENLTKKNKKKKGIVLVESDVRRSHRIKISKNGFKDPVCKDKAYLGYIAKPPALSNKAIRKLSSTLCDLNAS